ncbi:hypothetical protein JCM5350_000760 [Sporobolomyces pararoseus]
MHTHTISTMSESQATAGQTTASETYRDFQDREAAAIKAACISALVEFTQADNMATTLQILGAVDATVKETRDRVLPVLRDAIASSVASKSMRTVLSLKQVVKEAIIAEHKALIAKAMENCIAAQQQVNVANADLSQARRELHEKDQIIHEKDQIIHKLREELAAVEEQCVALQLQVTDKNGELSSICS